MNHHAVSTEAGGYLFAFLMSRRWLWITGVCVLAGVVIGIVANTTEAFRIPLAIALGVLAVTLLIAFGIKGSSQWKKQEPASGRARTRGDRTIPGRTGQEVFGGRTGSPCRASCEGRTL